MKSPRYGGGFSLSIYKGEKRMSAVSVEKVREVK
jgi:hypothetical protein